MLLGPIQDLLEPFIGPVKSLAAISFVGSCRTNLGPFWSLQRVGGMRRNAGMRQIPAGNSAGPRVDESIGPVMAK